MARRDTIAEEAWRYRIVIGGVVVSGGSGYNLPTRDEAVRAMQEVLPRYQRRAEEDGKPIEHALEHRPAGASRFVRVPV